MERTVSDKDGNVILQEINLESKNIPDYVINLLKQIDIFKKLKPRFMFSVTLHSIDGYELNVMDNTSGFYIEYSLDKTKLTEIEYTFLLNEVTENFEEYLNMDKAILLNMIKR